MCLASSRGSGGRRSPEMEGLCINPVLPASRLQFQGPSGLRLSPCITFVPVERFVHLGTESLGGAGSMLCFGKSAGRAPAPRPSRGETGASEPESTIKPINTTQHGCEYRPGRHTETGTPLRPGQRGGQLWSGEQWLPKILNDPWNV